MNSTSVGTRRTLFEFYKALQKVYLTRKTPIGYGILLLFILALTQRVRALQTKATELAKSEKNASNDQSLSIKNSSNIRGRVNRDFLKKLVAILKILYPKNDLRVYLLAFTHCTFLFLRTMISLHVADLDGKLVAYMVKRDFQSFFKTIGYWMAFAFPASFCNSILNYLQSRIALYYRIKLSGYITKKYLSSNTFYILSNLDKRIENFDQLITSDVTHFSKLLSNLFGSIGKPTIDLFVYGRKLANDIGKDTAIISAAILNLTGSFVRLISPPFGKYVAEEANLEGVFSSLHSRLKEYNEEIALQRGHEVERDNLDRAYFTLEKHVNRTLQRRFWHSMLQDFTFKYIWGSFGIFVSALPIYFPRHGSVERSERIRMFFTNRRLLINVSDAVSRIVSSGTQIMQLAGLTERIYSLLDAVNITENSQHAIVGAWSETLIKSNDKLKFSGNLEVADFIEFDNVPIVSPTGNILIEALSFKFTPGENLLLVGPNGSGKSSLFRILGGLWPVLNGTLRRPVIKDVFYLPQGVYMFSGSLRDQVIYPDDLQTMIDLGSSDQKLDQICQDLHCTALINRLGGWDSVCDWRENLSIGDQQMVSAIRLLYHQPKFAILDECSSGLTLASESIIYEQAIKRGITLMTVSHRSSLYKYHKVILAFDGKGGYSFGLLNAQRRIELEESRQKVEEELRKIEHTQQQMENYL